MRSYGAARRASAESETCAPRVTPPPSFEELVADLPELTTGMLAVSGLRRRRRPLVLAALILPLALVAAAWAVTFARGA